MGNFLTDSLLPGAQAASAAGGFVTGIIGAIQNSPKKQMQRQKEMLNFEKQNQMELMDHQNQIQQENWERENEYNSPLAQRRRMEAAGVAPANESISSSSSGIEGVSQGAVNSGPISPTASTENFAYGAQAANALSSSFKQITDSKLNNALALTENTKQKVNASVVALNEVTADLRSVQIASEGELANGRAIENQLSREAFNAKLKSIQLAADIAQQNLDKGAVEILNSKFDLVTKAKTWKQIDQQTDTLYAQMGSYMADVFLAKFQSAYFQSAAVKNLSDAELNKQLANLKQVETLLKTQEYTELVMTLPYRFSDIVNHSIQTNIDTKFYEQFKELGISKEKAAIANYYINMGCLVLKTLTGGFNDVASGISSLKNANTNKRRADREDSQFGFDMDTKYLGLILQLLPYML